MNKKYFKIVAAVLVLVAAGWNMKQNNSNVGLSDLALANIEALWVARNVKYLPISIKEACIKRNFSINVKCASGQCLDIKDIDGYTLINVKTNESIYLLSKYISVR